MGAAESSLGGMHHPTGPNDQSERELFREDETPAARPTFLSNSSVLSTDSNDNQSSPAGPSSKSVRNSLKGRLGKKAAGLFGSIASRAKKGEDTVRTDAEVFKVLNGVNGKNDAGDGVDTTVYAWGRADANQVFSKTPPPTSGVREVHEVERLRNLRVVKAACSLYHSLAVGVNGELIGCGDNTEGQLQAEKGADYFSKAHVISDDAIANKRLVAVACGLYHSAVLTAGGHVLSFGSNEFGQLGHTPNQLQRVHPKIMLPHHTAIQVACSEKGTHILTAQGKVFSCGMGAQGTLGMGDLEGRKKPTQVLGLLNGTPICHIAAGSMHVIALSVTGRVFSWGRNRHGQLGVAPDDIEVAVSPISVNYFNVAARRTGVESGLVFGSGLASDEGASHTGPSDKEATKLSSSSSIIRVQSMSCGEHHSAFVSTRGVVFVCGKANSGQLGVDMRQFARLDMVTPPAALTTLPSRARQVACGDTHTVVLLRTGGVFAFGDNAQGQTGDAAELQSTAMPRRLSTLDKVGVVRIEAGGNHAFAICDMNAELERRRSKSGLTRARAFSTPATAEEDESVNHHRYTISEQFVFSKAMSSRPVNRMSYESLVAVVGKNPLASSAHVASSKRPSNRRRASTMTPANNHIDMMLLRKIMQASLFEMHTLNASFLAHPIDERHRYHGTSTIPAPTKMSSSSSGLNVPAAVKAMDVILNVITSRSSTREGEFMRKKLNKLIIQLRHAAPTVMCRDQLRAYFLILLNPMVSTRLPREFKAFVIALDYLPGVAKDMLYTWVEKEFPRDRFESQLLKPSLGYADEYISALVWAPESISLCRFLKRLWTANDHVAEKKGKGIVSYQAFYATNPTRFTDEELGNEYSVWRQGPQTGDDGSHYPTRVSLLQYGFLLSAESKRRMMQFEDQAAMYRNAMWTAVMGSNPYFVFRVRREHLLQDTINQLLHAHPVELRKPLKVKFENEEGLDGGGVKKEFFQLLSLQLFNPDFGMFKSDPDTNELWFNPYGSVFGVLAVPGSTNTAAEDLTEFVLVGALMGLAIYNDTLLDVNFPLIIYRWMLGETPQISLRELRKIDPALAKSLKQMLDYHVADFEEVFCQSFEVSYEFFGEVRTSELKEDGKDIPVTRSNVKEYVHLYCKYVLQDSIASMARAFLKGFGMVVLTCSPALRLFRAEELELLVVGSQELDFAALEKNTSYEGGYSENSATVRMFWDVANGLTPQEKGLLMMFATGSSKAPVGGLGAAKFRFKIQRTGPDSPQLPTAHTCFNTLLLPDYKDRAKMSARLLLAIQNSEGFGLE